MRQIGARCMPSSTISGRERFESRDFVCLPQPPIRTRIEPIARTHVRTYRRGPSDREWMEGKEEEEEEEDDGMAASSASAHFPFLPSFRLLPFPPRPPPARCFYFRLAEEKCSSPAIMYGEVPPGEKKIRKKYCVLPERDEEKQRRRLSLNTPGKGVCVKETSVRVCTVCTRPSSLACVFVTTSPPPPCKLPPSPPICTCQAWERKGGREGGEGRGARITQERAVAAEYTISVKREGRRAPETGS